MSENIRMFNGIPYRRVTGPLKQQKALDEAMRLRRQSAMGKILARIDVYQSGYAVWKHDKIYRMSGRRGKVHSTEPTFAEKTLVKSLNRKSLLDALEFRNRHKPHADWTTDVATIRGKYNVGVGTYIYNITATFRVFDYARVISGEPQDAYFGEYIVTMNFYRRGESILVATIPDRLTYAQARVGMRRCVNSIKQSYKALVTNGADPIETIESLFDDPTWEVHI